MINYLSKKITNYYVKKQKIKIEDKEIYEYCFEVTLSTLLNLLAIIIVSIATKLYIEGAIFCIVFMSLRGLGGGYHAKTHLFCFLTIMIVFAVYVLILKFVNLIIIFYMTIAMLICGFLVISLIAPVDSETKPLTKNEKKRNKIKTLILLSLYTLTSSILLIFEKTKYYAFNITFPIFAVSILMILGTIKNLKWKKENKILEKNSEEGM